ncbi:LacI family transcriptional regulator, partial [Clostridium perfringens]
FTASDKMAFGAYKAIGEYGLSIPNDISVVSFDNVEMSEFINPPLTTVQVHKEEMGESQSNYCFSAWKGGYLCH